MKKIFYTLITGITCLISFTVFPIINGKIINDNPSLKEKYNDIVAIFLDNDGICTGSAIHPYIVLTVKHCANEDFLLRVVKSNQLKDEDLHDSKSIYVIKPIVHSKNDLALLILEKKLDISFQEIHPLLTSAEVNEFLIQEEQRALILGFGVDENYDLTGHKRYKNVTNFSPHWFIDFFHEKIYVFSEGADMGDSGGPVFITRNGKERQVGIISTRSNLSSKFRAVRIDQYIDWIHEKIGFIQGKDDLLSDDFSKKIEQKFLSRR